MRVRHKRLPRVNHRGSRVHCHAANRPRVRRWQGRMTFYSRASSCFTCDSRRPAEMPTEQEKADPWAAPPSLLTRGVPANKQVKYEMHHPRVFKSCGK